MHITKIGTCRGSGKVYIQYKVNGLHNNQMLRITAPHVGMDQIPCEIYEMQEPSDSEDCRYFVAAFPDLRRSLIKFVIESIDNDGSIADSSKQSLYFEMAKWQSRLNYRVNKRLCEKIRDYDEVAAYDKAQMEFWECIEDGSELIIRGAVYTPYRDDTELVITCFDDELKPIDIAETPFGTAKVQTPFTSERSRREFQYSIRIPNSIKRYIFQIKDKLHPDFNNYSVLDDVALAELVKANRYLRNNAQNDPAYTKWLKQNRATLGALSKQRDIEFPVKPCFSIVVPLFKTPLNLFNEMVESVRAQTYGNWELILINASPDDKNLANKIGQITELDSRITCVWLSSNLGISENTNAGIAVAKGDFICFFDHDDVIEPDLLFSYAEAINTHDDIDLLYCDEDKLMWDGSYTHPFFKPDFDLELLRNNNYICHMLAIRRTLLAELKPNTKEFDGAQDHNLTLQAVEKARRIHHVPKILYHWRICENSTASDADSKPYASEAGIRAVQSHLDRLGIMGKVSLSRRPFTYKVTYDVPKNRPLVSILIPTKDQVEILDKCVQSILKKTTYENYEIILIENNSTNSSTFDYYNRILKEHSDRILVIDWKQEFNFSKLMNFGASAAHGEYLILLNNDTEIITSNWIEVMLGICSQQDVGAVGVKLYYPDETIQHAGVTVSGMVAGHLGKSLPRNDWGYFALLDAQRELSAVTAACMMTKRSTFERVHGFTEELQVAFNDVDYCLKVRELGERIVFTPEVELYHYESISRGSDTLNEDTQARFCKEIAYMNYRWVDIYVKGDPYSNINFYQNEPLNSYYHLS